MVLLVLVTVLGACGSTPEPQVVEVPVEVTRIVEVEKEVPIAKTTVIINYNRFFNISNNDDYPAPIDVIRQEVAKKYPEIDVQLNLAPDDQAAWQNALATWFTAKDSTIDLYGMDVTYPLEFHQAGWAEPLQDYLPNIYEDFMQAGLDIYTIDGDLLAVPFWNGAWGLAYRTDLLEEYGFDAPETWDDVVEIATTIMADQPELSGYQWAAAQTEQLIQAWLEFHYAFGGQFFNEDGSCAVNSPEGIEAVKFMKSLFDDGITPRAALSWDINEAQLRFLEGNAIFLRGQRTLVTYFDNPDRSKIVGKWNYIPNPAQPGGIHAGSTGGYGMAMNPYTDVKDAAIKVLEVIAGKEVQRGFALAWGPIQFYKGISEDPTILELYPKIHLLEAISASSLPRPQHTQYARLSDIIQEQVHSALTGIKPVEDALNDACKQVDVLGSK